MFSRLVCPSRKTLIHRDSSCIPPHSPHALADCPHAHTFPLTFSDAEARSQGARRSSALFKNLSPADDIIMPCQCVTSREPGCISRINMHGVGGGACPRAANAYNHSLCDSAAPLVLGSHHIPEQRHPTKPSGLMRSVLPLLLHLLPLLPALLPVLLPTAVLFKRLLISSCSAFICRA